MTDRNKFEQMLEHLINDESDKAKELFHQLVVEKSREIYENILAEDFNEAKEEDDEETTTDESKLNGESTI
jgi:two-component SAPR family response regulator